MAGSHGAVGVALIAVSAVASAVELNIGRTV